MEALDTEEWLRPSDAGRLFTPPVTGVRVVELVKEGRLEGCKTALGTLIRRASVAAEMDRRAAKAGRR